MGNVCVVPGGGGGQRAAANFHAVGAVGLEPVEADEGTFVVGKLGEVSERAGAAAIVRVDWDRHGISIDAHELAGIVPDDVVHNDGLSAADKDGSAVTA